MVARRKYNTAKRKVAKKYKTTVKKANVSASALQAAVRRTLFKNAETKQAQISSSDYVQIGHNSFVNIDNAVLATTQGTTDPNSSANACRIGDEITLLKAKFCMMLELNERYSDVSYRIIVVKSARGDTPTTSTLFNGLSGNKMLDTLNYERYSVIYQKWGKIKAPPISTGESPSQAGTASGIFVGSNASANYLSRATKIIKFSVDGKKFAPNGIIKYDGAGQDGKFFDFNVLVYAYSNYSTSSALGYNVLAVNDYYHLLQFKDI